MEFASLLLLAPALVPEPDLLFFECFGDVPAEDLSATSDCAFCFVGGVFSFVGDFCFDDLVAAVEVFAAGDVEGAVEVEALAVSAGAGGEAPEETAVVPDLLPGEGGDRFGWTSDREDDDEGDAEGTAEGWAVAAAPGDPADWGLAVAALLAACFSCCAWF